MTEKVYTIGIVSDAKFPRRLAFDLEAASAEFAAHFAPEAKTDYASHVSHAMQSLRESNLRSVYWRYFLEYFNKDSTSSDWQAIADAHRATYVRELNEATSGPADGPNNADDLRTHNPLSSSKDSNWNQYFEVRFLSLFLFHMFSPQARP